MPGSTSANSSRKNIVSPERRSVPRLTGHDLILHPRYNRGIAFTEEERDLLGLRGLLPPRVVTLKDQVERSMQHLARKATPLERYIYMTGLLDRGETLFYRTLIDHIEELANRNLDVVLFPDFPLQGFSQPLAKLDCTAGEFP